MKSWVSVERHDGGGWHIAATNPAQSVVMVNVEHYGDAMQLARMVASTLRLDVKTRMEETP